MEKLSLISKIVVIVVITIFFFNHHSEARELRTSEENVIIVFQNAIDKGMIKSYGGVVIEEFKEISAASAVVPINVIPELKRLPGIVSVEIDRNVYAKSQSVTWGMKDINAVPLLESSLTGEGVNVAVLDSGIDITHPDLKVAGGVSVLGYTTSFNDDNGHGTHVAGIIAAQNNNVGVVGVAPDVALYAIKVLDQDGVGKQSDVIEGIEWAINHHMDIINLSLSSPTGSLALKKELNRAYELGILIVGVAGNMEFITGETDTVGYPAKYESVIATAAVNNDNKHPSFSSKGPEVELSAPGVDILSTYLNEKYASISGTSMAAPYVTGVLALYKQENPSLEPERIRQVLRLRAIDLGDKGKDPLYGYGLVRAPSEISADLTKPTVPKNLQASVSFIDGYWRIQIQWNAASDNEEVTNYQLFINEKLTANLMKTGYQQKASANNYYVQVRSVDRAGNVSELSQPLFIQVTKYSDLQPTSWFAAYVHELSTDGIIEGYPNGEFRPQNDLTRAEAVTMLGRAFGYDGKEMKTVFPDVDPDFYASGYIYWASSHAIVQGYPDGTFRSNRPITRSEVAYLLSRAYNLKSIESNPFSDIDPTRKDFLAINKLYSSGIAKGYPDGTFRPNNNVTRAEYTAFLVRAMSIQ